MLGISLRTLDRYIKSGKCDFRRIDRRVVLNRDDLEFLTGKGDRLKSSENVARENLTQQMESVQMKPSRIESSRQESDRRESEPIFQKLYTDLIREMKEQQKRLEGANYRVGQLEAELKNTVPLLEYQTETTRQKEREHQMMERLKKEEQETCNVKLVRQEEARRMNYALRIERMNKIAYAIVLCIIVALQPIIWMMVR